MNQRLSVGTIDRMNKEKAKNSLLDHYGGEYTEKLLSCRSLDLI